MRRQEIMEQVSNLTLALWNEGKLQCNKVKLHVTLMHWNQGRLTLQRDTSKSRLSADRLAHYGK